MTDRKLKIYVASSWRNKEKVQEVYLLREKGHEVCDFTRPENSIGFSWSEYDPDWKSWAHEQYTEAIYTHPAAKRGFKSKMNALKWCDLCILLMPCNRSAHLELGWAVGAGKKTIVLRNEGDEPELMYRMVDNLCVDFVGMLDLVDMVAT